MTTEGCLSVLLPPQLPHSVVSAALLPKVLSSVPRQIFLGCPAPSPKAGTPSHRELVATAPLKCWISQGATQWAHMA